MAKYNIREIKEIIIETTVEANDAQEAFMVYKNRHTRHIRHTGTSKFSEETHITVKESEEVGELINGQE
ncbi:hypothetical protein ACUXCC_002931 [Cytobacillus horneckiae]|uniref:hypothetical protein n=1 Tax=Cytobacillus horneckiae TaxID=549687 RepID=UPI0019D214ED|nr:hypothetical protein [Cytobacillus horneckiae]MBN6887767.1 hypothetical protein [Cytobacillus horneckiae]